MNMPELHYNGIWQPNKLKTPDIYTIWIDIFAVEITFKSILQNEKIPYSVNYCVKICLKNMFEKYVMFEMQSVSPPGSQKGHVDSISLEQHP